MTRLLILAAIVLFIISSVSAQIVSTLNTPLGPITQGATVPVTWTNNAGVVATGKNGVLTAQDTNTKNTIPINQSVPLAPQSFMWTVDVPPSNYTLGLNDGSGIHSSGAFQIVAGAPGSSSSASSSGTTQTASSTTPSSESPSPSRKNSASSIFSGYEVTFSLLGVAVAMIQF